MTVGELSVVLNISEKINTVKGYQMDFAIIEHLKEIKSLMLERSNDHWMGIKEVTQYTNLSESTIRRYIKKGVLKVSDKTGKLLFKRSNIDKWLKG